MAGRERGKKNQGESEAGRVRGRKNEGDGEGGESEGERTGRERGRV